MNLNICKKCEYASGVRVNGRDDMEKLCCDKGIHDNGIIYNVIAAVDGLMAGSLVMYYSAPVPVDKLNFDKLRFNLKRFPLPDACPYHLEQTLS